ncbi:MAG: hypothetical protein K2X91_13930 [Thermoleophilia bacterium]|nr:hypothetical protein [Thermoleophilia bacterium]
MSPPIGIHPAGTSGLCQDSMLLPPQAEGRRLRCQLDAGHPGLHTARDGDGIRRSWPRAGKTPSIQNARAAAGANVTPIKKGKP